MINNHLLDNSYYFLDTMMVQENVSNKLANLETVLYPYTGLYNFLYRFLPILLRIGDFADLNDKSYYREVLKSLAGSLIILRDADEWVLYYLIMLQIRNLDSSLHSSLTRLIVGKVGDTITPGQRIREKLRSDRF